MHIQEIKISVPDGKKAVYDEATQAIKFIDVEPVRSKSWKEFCKNHRKVVVNKEYFLSSETIIYCQDERNRNEFCDRNLLTSREDVEGIIALIQLKRLHDEWVGDWKPFYGCIKVYDDSTERTKTQAQEKYSIVYYEEELIVDVTYNNQRFLTFPTKEMATEFLSYFKDLIKTAKMFI